MAYDAHPPVKPTAVVRYDTGNAILSSLLDHWLTRRAAHKNLAGGITTRMLDTSAGTLRVFDSATPGPSIVLVPDGPNTIERYSELIELLSSYRRVICFDMPGFGFSRPAAHYTHSLDQGARAVLGVLDQLGIERTTLAFSCANGLYAMRVAQLAPSRVASLFLAQTPSLTAMHVWTDRVIPRVLHTLVVGQAVAWAVRRKLAEAWYHRALPESTDPQPFLQPSLQSLAAGGCVCLAGVVQGLSRERQTSLMGLTVPCTMLWGMRDHSHRLTEPETLLYCVPNADIIRFADVGHFPDVEQPQRYAECLLKHLPQHDMG